MTTTKMFTTQNQPPNGNDMPRKHSHYFRDVSHLKEIDIYRFLELFNVTDQALGHAIKKLVAPGGRGAGKDFRKDVQEAIDTLQRRLEMMDEDAPIQKAEAPPSCLRKETCKGEGEGWTGKGLPSFGALPPIVGYRNGD